MDTSRLYLATVFGLWQSTSAQSTPFYNPPRRLGYAINILCVMIILFESQHPKTCIPSQYNSLHGGRDAIAHCTNGQNDLFPGDAVRSPDRARLELSIQATDESSLTEIT